MKQKSNEAKAKDFIKNSLKARQRTGRVMQLPGSGQADRLLAQINKELYGGK